VILHGLGMFVAAMFKSRRRLEADNLFLRHQLNIALRRAPPRLRLHGIDRALLVRGFGPICLIYGSWMHPTAGSLLIRRMRSRRPRSIFDRCVYRKPYPIDWGRESPNVGAQ
jgi:hypothetical protein